MDISKILITGSGSGLGKYLRSNLGGVGVTRSTNLDDIADKEWDLIIHCAFNRSHDESKFAQVLEDNIMFTTKLLTLKSKHFSYISSVDIYNYKLGQPANLYIKTKMLSEHLITMLREPLSYSILRCSALVGPTMRRNHLLKIIDGGCEIGLHEDSTFNYVLYKDIARFYQQEQHRRVFSNTVDFVANSNIRLGEVAEMFDSDVKFGDHTYRTQIDGPGGNANHVYHHDTYYDKSSKYNLSDYFEL